MDMMICEKGRFDIVAGIRIQISNWDDRLLGDIGRAAAKFGGSGETRRRSAGCAVLTNDNLHFFAEVA